jgi:UDP-N-acetylglucosamine--N-acetylmuramyl-(pentapeptide) pyrophosphoryl-undecaprenol N-acetylglucosamine transferase
MSTMMSSSSSSASSESETSQSSSAVTETIVAATSPSKTLRVLVTGGGTGGHVFPALAVIEALSQANAQFYYVGNHHRMEAHLIPEKGLPFKGLSFSGLPQKKTGFVLWGFQLLWAIVSLLPLFWTFRPQVVFATGGYVTAPVLLVAMLTRTPYVLHEPDAHPGKVNRVFARWAAHVTCGFFAAAEDLHAKEVTPTGNPLRPGILDANPSQEIACEALGLTFQAKRKTLLVLGGSLGAQRLNEIVQAALPELTTTLGLQVLHQVGEAHYESYQKGLSERDATRADYAYRPFLTDMASAYALADIVLCRAGALTLSELYAAGKPSILVPYPYAAADHQTQNAKTAADAGAAVWIADSELTREALLRQLRDWLVSPEALERMSQAAHRLARPRATRDIAAIVAKAAR